MRVQTAGKAKKMGKKDPKFGSIDDVPARREAIDQLIATLKPVKVSSLRPTR